MKLFILLLLITLAFALKKNNLKYDENFSKVAEELISNKADNYKGLSMDEIDQDSTHIDLNFSALSNSLKDLKSSEGKNKENRRPFNTSNFLNDAKQKIGMKDEILSSIK